MTAPDGDRGLLTICRDVTTHTPRAAVAPYLSNFSTTEVWDPHTHRCYRVDSGPLRVGSEFVNEQRMGPLRTTLHYRVRDYQPGRSIALTSAGRFLHVTDSMRFEDTPQAGTRVTYRAEFRLPGWAATFRPLLRRLSDRIADDAVTGLRGTLARLQPSQADGG